MRKLVFFISFLVLSFCCQYLKAEVDMSNPLIVTEDTPTIGENELEWYTYIRIEDSSKPFIIYADQSNTRFTNKSIYVGRNLEMPKYKDYDDGGAGKFPWDNYIPINNYQVDYLKADEIIFGEEVTQVPVYKPDFSMWGGLGSGYIRINTPCPINPFSLNPGAIVRFNCRNLENFYQNEANEEDRNNCPHIYRNDPQIIIGSKCESFPGNYITSYAQYLYVEAENPPALIMPFFNSVTEKVTLYVPEGCAVKYRAAEGWKEFRNIVEGRPSGISDIKSDIHHSIMVKNGVLRIEGDLSAEDIVEVYGIDGSRIYSGASKEISVPRGVLIVKCGKEIRKIVN